MLDPPPTLAFSILSSKANDMDQLPLLAQAFTAELKEMPLGLLVSCALVPRMLEVSTCYQQVTPIPKWLTPTLLDGVKTFLEQPCIGISISTGAVRDWCRPCELVPSDVSASW